MLLIHGVLRAADADAVERAQGLPVAARALITGAVAALVSGAPERELVPEDAAVHLDLLVALVTDVPVLPLAFGTVAPDDDAVRDELLAPRAEEFERQLAAVAGLVELRLDLTFDNDASVAAVVREDPSLRRLAAGAAGPGAGFGDRLALGEAVAGSVAEEQAALAEAWSAELDAVAERGAVLHTDEQTHRSAYLVRRDRLAEADAAVERLRAAAEGRAELEYVGPLPVYSFADLDDAGASAAPAPTSRWGW